MNFVERGYDIFKNYRISDIKNACTACCLSEEEVNNLVNLDLSVIDIDLLSTYNDSAQAYEPSVLEFKHFLPRYIDLLDQFEFPSHSVELCLQNISNYSEKDWTIEERNYLNEFATYYFKKCLATFPIPNNWSGLSSILIMLGRAGFDLSEFLKIWSADDSTSGCLHYKELSTSELDWLRKARYSNAFATKEQAALVYNWAVNPEIQKKYSHKIEEVIMGDSDLEAKDLEELNWLYDTLNSENL